MRFKYPVVDSHIHISSFEEWEKIKNATQNGNYEQFTILSGAFVPDNIAGNLLVANIKEHQKNRVYGYASFHRLRGECIESEDLLEQAKDYYNMGFDGIKMLDGKPTIRSLNGIPLDDPVYDDMLFFLEEKEIPLLYHINDPVEFWDCKKIPVWAQKAGYLYDETIPSFESIQKETLRMLKKHPNLNITIAHFFFLSNSNDYDLACQLMENYKNVYLDLTPGWEMFENFGEKYEQWRDFQEHYSDPLIFGTDICASNYKGVQEPLKACLETEDVFEKSGVVCHGMNLSDIALKNIYYNTYKKNIQTDMPKKVQWGYVYEYIEKLKVRIRNSKMCNKEKLLRELIGYEKHVNM